MKIEKYWVALDILKFDGTTSWVTSRRKMTEFEMLEIFAKGNYQLDLIKDFSFAMIANFIVGSKKFSTKKEMLEFVKGEEDDT